MARGELVALLVTVTLPEKLPEVVGANVMLKDVDCPAARVTGNTKPAALNPAELMLICETDTLELPVFARVIVCVPLVPVVTLPKLSEAGDTVSWATCDTPVPARATTSGEFSVLFTRVSLPERLLAEAGVKLTVKAEEPPGGTESGSASPEKLKPVPVSDAWVTLRFAVPGLLMASIWVLVIPTVTLPKPTLAGTTEICGCTPLPLNEIVAGELLALLTKLRLPVTLPTVAGAKLTASETLWPAARVMAPLKPLKLNPAPVMAACERLTLAVPVFVSTRACDPELPTRVFPKFRLLALVDSKYDGDELDDVEDADGAVVPVPETDIDCVPPFVRLELKTMLPVKVLAASG
jgi:hypothetical protein